VFFVLKKREGQQGTSWSPKSLSLTNRKLLVAVLKNWGFGLGKGLDGGQENNQLEKRARKR